MPDYSLRPVTPEDDQFLLKVFTESHPEYDFLPLPPEQKESTIDMQYRLQTADYSSRYPDSRHEIIVSGGEDVGRVWSVRLEEGLRIADIGLVASARNTGLGTKVMQAIQQEAQAMGKPLRTAVFKFNEGSIRWHVSLGFQLEREDEYMYFLIWQGAPPEVS